MLRNPTWPDLRVHDHEASLPLLNADESGSGVETLVAQQVGREFGDNANRVEDEARNRITRRRVDVNSFSRLVTLYGAAGRVDGPLERSRSALPLLGRPLAQGRCRSVRFRGHRRQSLSPAGRGTHAGRASRRRAYRLAQSAYAVIRSDPGLARSRPAARSAPALRPASNGRIGAVLPSGPCIELARTRRSGPACPVLPFELGRGPARARSAPNASSNPNLLKPKPLGDPCRPVVARGGHRGGE